MNERLDVPLIANPDETHCFQACLKMMLESPGSETSYTWEELDTISSKVEGLWTWPMAAWLWMQRHNFEITVINTFDYRRFAEEGSTYLIEYTNEETAAAQIKNSNIAQERKFAAQLIEEVALECRVPDLKDIKQALGRQSLVCCSVNSHKLNGLPGFMGHFVVVTGYDDTALYFKDPGGTSREAAKESKVSYKSFEAAWGDPTPEVKDLFTVKQS
jgi:hypothetical protein